MIDSLLKFVLGLCVIALIFMVNAERTKPIVPDLLEIQLKDDTPTPEVTIIKPIDRVRVEVKPLDAVFFCDTEVSPSKEEIVRKRYTEHMTFMLNELKNLSVLVLSDDFSSRIDTTDRLALLKDVIDFPTTSELYDENIFLEWEDIQSAIIQVDDFEIRVKLALPRGEFANILTDDLEQYRNILDTRLDNPQKFWSLISEYEITTYLEQQNLNTLEDISSDILYDDIMLMMNDTGMKIQRNLWNDHIVLDIYLSLFNERK